MRILVAQMTRMGDMLQNSTLTRALRQRYPDAHITAMVRPLARAIAERNPDIDDIILYEEDAMFCALRSRDSDRLLRAYRSAAALVNDLNARQFDIVYNCTLSIASAMLLKLVHAPRTVGAHLSDDWRFVLRGRWTNYFFTSVYQRAYSDINISDVFRNLMEDAPPVPGLTLAITDEDRREARDILARHGIGEQDFVVCMQLGASDASKRWPVTHFAELARRLAAEKSAKICLLGVESEAPLGEAFEAQAPGLAVHLLRLFPSWRPSSNPRACSSPTIRAPCTLPRPCAVRFSSCRSDTFIFVRPVPTAKAIWRSNAGKTTSPP